MLTQVDGKRDLPIGTIVYPQDGLRPLGGPTRPAIFRNPWMVTAWLPRRCMGLAMRGGHLAIIRSLRDGRQKTVANWLLRNASEV